MRHGASWFASALASSLAIGDVMNDGTTRKVLIVALLERLRRHGAYCSETSVHKALFLAQSLFDVPLGIRWTLHHYGPYSPGLRAELQHLCHSGVLESIPESDAGPHLDVRDQGRRLVTANAADVLRWAPQLDVVAGRLAPLKVHDLEAVATAWWVTQTAQDASMPDRVRALREVKPHISRDHALASMQVIDELRVIAEEFGRKESLARVAQDRIRELRTIALNFYVALSLTAIELHLGVAALCDIPRSADRFDGPALEASSATSTRCRT